MLDNDEQNGRVQEYKMECIAPDGLGYGEGTTSVADRATHPQHPITKEELRQAVEVIVAHWDEVIVPVEVDDDGCGDGRPTTKILQLDTETGEVIEHHTSMKRAKIFGGGLQVTASMWRAVAGEALNGETVLGDRVFLAKELRDRNVRYGSHIGQQAHGNDCGCGAIDNYSLSTKVSGRFHDDILRTLELFFDSPATNAGVSRAFESRAKISDDSSYMSNATGRETMDFIISDGALVKEAGDEHLELIVMMNDQPGTTADQEKIATLLQSSGLPDGVQVFVVDIWRGRMYADIVADISSERGYDRAQAQEVALADFFINQLSVAATLTKGDLPVIINRLPV